ncbi:(2Fe-2S)-binding protein [Rhodobacteraceae bacterium CH30]|nr:(2Fe-2S)-binding protein [Rhodobacteraceae bacterium CH30]
MVRLRFFRPPQDEAFACVEAEQGTLLLDVARAHGLPLHWRCGQGTCGTCRILLHHTQQPALFTPSARERNVLKRFGFAASTEPVWPDRPDTWRLACHVSVGSEDLDIHLPEA